MNPKRLYPNQGLREWNENGTGLVHKCLPTVKELIACLKKLNPDELVGLETFEIYEGIKTEKGNFVALMSCDEDDFKRAVKQLKKERAKSEEGKK